MASTEPRYGLNGTMSWPQWDHVMASMGTCYGLNGTMTWPQ